MAETAIATVPTQSVEAAEFDLMQRQAKLFASSPLVPAHIGDGGSTKGLANCYIALVLAKQMGENPLVVMQNIYIVHGRAGWSASYMIAKANASGIFKGVIRFSFSGEGKNLECTAKAILKDTGEEVSTTVGMAMAEAEGWTKNAKYKSMPRQMLTYRAATFLVRTYCPQVMLGYRTADEVEDIIASETRTQPSLSIASVTADDTAEVVNEDGEVVSANAQLFPGDADYEKAQKADEQKRQHAATV